jgi:methyl-accepting chemotaxis protein
MPDRKLQSKFVFRFRPPAEPGQYERGESSVMTGSLPEVQSQESGQMNTVEMQQSAQQQIKEVLRLSDLVRTGQSLNEIGSQIASSIARLTGFNSIVISRVEERYIRAFAFAGISEEDQRTLLNSDDTLEDFMKFLRQEFRISHSYYISHKHTIPSANITIVYNMSMDDYQAGGWHPDDLLFVPLYSPREQRLLGFISLDNPLDRQIPSQERIELIELFAVQAALAIDNAQLAEEREAEQQALEKEILLLHDRLEQVQRGDLRARVHTTHTRLQPLVEVINNVIEEIGSILGSMQMVTLAVDEHARSVHRNSELLARDTHQQEQQVHQISSAVNEIATMMHRISENATTLAKTAVDAMDVTLEAQSAVDRAVNGMGSVREATMQSARTMKALSESGQEINETVLLITDLTTRMHHLALNAAIEATRAGEHGQGFAVVAQEMRTLAVHGGEAARKIATYIRTIQHEMTAVSQSVEQNTQQVVVQTELVTQTGVALEAVSMTTEQFSDLIQSVCSVAESQSQGAQPVVNAVKEILRMTEGITQHMRGMQQSLEHLIELTNSLRSRMALLRINER